MSVLKSRRSESRAEFVNTAHSIFKETLCFVSKLSAKYSRLLSAHIIELASSVLSETEKANSIYPSDEIKKQHREVHLIEARASLMALDIQLANCYDILMLNPQGCFETANKKAVGVTTAKEKLNKMSERLGGLIDKENSLITTVLKSDKNR